MASLSRLPWSAFLCIESSAWSLTCQTGACLLFRSVSLPRRDWNLRLHWPLNHDVGSKPTARRSKLEVFASPHGSQSTDAAAYDLRAVHRDPSGGRALSLGVDRI